MNGKRKAEEARRIPDLPLTLPGPGMRETCLGPPVVGRRDAGGDSSTLATPQPHPLHRAELGVGVQPNFAKPVCPVSVGIGTFS